VTGKGLVQLSKAVQLLSEARTLDDVTQIHSMARAAEEYARAEKLGNQAEHHAREIRLRAARKAGAILREMAEKGERRKRGVSKGPQTHHVERNDMVPTLTHLGITGDQSTRWQRLAAVPEDEFADRIANGWGETAIARGQRHGGDSKKRSPRRQTLLGLQNAAIALQSLAEGLEGQMFGDWSLLYDMEKAQPHFDVIEESLPVVNARLKRVLRERRANGGQVAG